MWGRALPLVTETERGFKAVCCGCGEEGLESSIVARSGSQNTVVRDRVLGRIGDTLCDSACWSTARFADEAGCDSAPANCEALSFTLSYVRR